MSNDPGALMPFDMCATILMSAADGMEILERRKGNYKEQYCFASKAHDAPFNFAEYEYQVAPVIDEDIDWSKTTYNWVAVDADGTVNGFEVKPVWDNYWWMCGDASANCQLIGDCHKQGGEKSLFERTRFSDVIQIGAHSYTVEFDKEDDGRIIAEVDAIPGMLAYGATIDEARGEIVEKIKTYLIISSSARKVPNEDVPGGMLREYITIKSGATYPVDYRYSVVAKLWDGQLFLGDGKESDVCACAPVRSEVTRQIKEKLEKKWEAENVEVTQAVTLADGRTVTLGAAKVVSGDRWVAFSTVRIGFGLDLIYGATSGEAIEKLRKFIDDELNGHSVATMAKRAIEDFDKEAMEELTGLRKLFEWFCDFDEDKPTVEQCIRRLEEMRTAEQMLRDFMYSYERKQPFLYQHYFPKTKE